MTTEAKIPNHTCEDCVYKELFKGKNGCILLRQEFNAQPVDVVNKCPEWQN